ncbi:MAG: DNA-processing protein DprA [Planctomycetota bacterium]
MDDAHLMLAVAEGFGQSPVPGLLAPGQRPEQILADPPEPPAIPPRVARRLRAHGPHGAAGTADLQREAAAIRTRCDKLGIRILTPRDEHTWPERLSEQPMPPLVMFVRGDPAALCQDPGVAVVGSRTPTPYGVECVETIATTLVRAGAVIWSGLARGVDARAHQAAVAAGRPTVAVLAGGLDEIYPSEHDQLAERIVAANGCLVSELPPGNRARRGHFVRRNRLLAAGARAVLVVEGSLASGALHTARFAADCSTDIFAVPGPWRSERSQGPHRLIAEGAAIVESPEGLLRDLGLVAASPNTAHGLERASERETLLAQLDQGPRPTDLLRRESGLDEAAFLRALFELERGGAIARLPGDLWRAAGGA